MRQVAEEIEERFGVTHLAMAHRVGTLAIGDIAVGIAAASAHRDAAFKACRYAIDRIKQILPIWKKEFGEDGVAWVEGCAVNAETAEPPKARRISAFDIFPLPARIYPYSNKSRRRRCVFG